MGTYRLNLELPCEPEPAVLLQVMKLLGLLAPIDDDDKKAAAPPVENPVAASQPIKEQPLLLSRAEAAGQLNISTSTLDRLRKRGVLPEVNVPGSAPKFSQRALRQFVAANSRVNSPPRPRRSRSSDRAQQPSST